MENLFLFFYILFHNVLRKEVLFLEKLNHVLEAEKFFLSDQRQHEEVKVGFL